MHYKYYALIVVAILALTFCFPRATLANMPQWLRVVVVLVAVFCGFGAAQQLPPTFYP